jgi:hypothetical protein
MSDKIKERAIELFQSGVSNKSEITRSIMSEQGLENFNAIRMKVRSVLDNLPTDKGIVNAASNLEVNASNVPYLWLKSKEASLFVRNPNYKVSSIDFDAIISECMAGFKPVKKVKAPKTKLFDRLIWTDVHVGMDASRKGLALYDAEWSAIELMKRVDMMVDFVIDNKVSNTLIIDELGDYLDGWDGETTRKGHHLPQNMTNEEAFDNGLRAKLYMIEKLAPHFKHITCNNICEDNHAGAFGYILNSAFKSIVDCKFENVIVINHKKFINFYIVGDHGFIISHGKDSRNLKFGFKPQLDPRSTEKISQYIRHNNELRSCKYIEFSKGDSHQCLFDMCTSDEFDYFNFPAFSPSSEWVQTNFKKGRSGFVLQNIDMYSDRKNLKPYFFN